jgi:hypothetical protein
MYALAAAGYVYHLAQNHRTLCGLFVVGELRIVTRKPTDRILCKHCERVAPSVPKPKA